MCVGKYKRKAVAALVASFLALNLSGCAGKATPAAQDLTVISTACGAMSRTDSYSFFVKKDKDEWLFSASCYTDSDAAPVVLESQPISKAEMQELFTLAEERNAISAIQNYKKPWFSRFVQAQDQPSYTTLLRFADGQEYDAKTGLNAALLNYFYRLAEKYGKPSQEESSGIIGISVFCSEMTYDDCYSFELKKGQAGWCFTYHCAFLGNEGYTRTQGICRDVAREEALKIVHIAADEQLVQRIRRHQEPAGDGVEVLDGPEYRTTIGFADGKSISAPLGPSASLKKAFYQLAEKYEHLPNNGEKDE